MTLEKPVHSLSVREQGIKAVLLMRGLILRKTELSPSLSISSDATQLVKLLLISSAPSESNPELSKSLNIHGKEQNYRINAAVMRWPTWHWNYVYPGYDN